MFHLLQRVNFFKKNRYNVKLYDIQKAFARKKIHARKKAHAR